LDLAQSHVAKKDLFLRLQGGAQVRYIGLEIAANNSNFKLH
jgi:hypothetical protein